MTPTVTLSELLRTPNDVIAQLDKGDVLLSRREGRTLRLSFAEPAEAQIDAIEAITNFIGAAANEALYARMAEGLDGEFPWMELLPRPARAEFVAEFLRTTRACIAVSRFDQLVSVLAGWRATAEACADPRISTDASDHNHLFASAAGARPTQ